MANSSSESKKNRGQNLIEKIAQKFLFGMKEGTLVLSGDYISIKPAHVLTHDNSGAVISKFRAMGAKKVANPKQPVFALDHNVQDKSEGNLKKYASIENFARDMGIDFYPAGRGIGHQIMCEEGYAWPGTMVVASDSHANMYGGLGCLGTPIVRTDAAAIWATGRTWWQVPPVTRVELKGKLRQGVSGKDIIIALCGLFSHEEVLNHALEFTGDGIPFLTIDQRLTIANMTTEWGALAGVFPIDDLTIEWLRKRIHFLEKRNETEKHESLHPRIHTKAIANLEMIYPDFDANYAGEIVLELSSITPCVAGPDQVSVVHSVASMEKQDIKIHKAYLVSCVNSRADDIKEAAAVVQGKKIASGVKFYISAASMEVQQKSERRGDWRTLIEAGAHPLPPGCGPCIGLGDGLLKDGEIGISSTNRNFKGRMGSPKAQTYLASPSVVAASAIAGKIKAHEHFEEIAPIGHFKLYSKAVSAQEVVTIEGFPETIEGEIIFCPQDNLNTDGIYPGKYTYKDDMNPKEQAAVVMENYDPEFNKIAKSGDILVSGYNFGTGSSREQAATALKYKGIKMVIAASFSETYKRNAINNGFLTVDAPEFVNYLKKQFSATKPTIQTKMNVVVDFKKSKITLGSHTYPIGPIGTPAQELILAGGLERWVEKQIKKN